MIARGILFFALVITAHSAWLYAGNNASEQVMCSGGNRVVALLVDPALLDLVRSGLDQFEADLCSDGYTVYETSEAFTSPPEIRGYLADLRIRTSGQMIGSVLVGNFPRAYQSVTLTSTNPSIPSTSEEVISYQYYADLDGEFSASPEYQSPGNHEYSFDVHGGNIDWEIWIGVLPYYEGDLARTADAVRRYFIKNHEYRLGSTLPRVFLQVTELLSSTTLEEQVSLLDGLRSGIYSWTPFSNSPDARIHFDSPAGGMTVDTGYADLAAGVADFTVQDAHGYWGASGKLDIAYVESNPVQTYYFWSNGCSVGNLDHESNFLTSLLYSSTSSVLVAKGTTNNSGGMGNNTNGFFGHNIATALTQNQSFGQAILNHVNVPLIYPWNVSREFHFATSVVLGDPTLGFAVAVPQDLGSGVSSDFNGDSKPDVLWRNLSTGENYIWYLDGVAVLGGGSLPMVADQNWSVVGVADFNKDRKPDVLWRNISTGENHVWYLDGVTVTGGGSLPMVADQNWSVVGVADFDNNGDVDILWRNTSTGENYIWYLDGVTVTGVGSLPTVADQGWLVVGAADFNSDGKVDVIWRNVSTGENYVWYLNGAVVTDGCVLPTVTDQNWKLVGLADFNNNSKPDILWRHSITGENYVWYLDGLAVLGGGNLPTVTDQSWTVVP